MFLKYWDHILENEEIEMFLRCTITSLPKEEEAPIASPIEEQAFHEHVEEESLHEDHDPITCTPFQTLIPLDASFDNL